MCTEPLPSAFGRYQVLSRLGQGGSSKVYLAYDPQLDRQVAVKALPGRNETFQRDAQFLTRLEHEAIVPVYDAGEQDGQPFLVLRYMPGGSLDDRLDRGRLSPTEALPLLQRLGRALDFVHDHGVLHCDIKPANVLYDASGAACLSDFGIARLLHAHSDPAQEGTYGTPAYMSPEQARGQALTPAADVYSLGVLVFLILSGELPFQADDAGAMAQCHAETPPPSLRRLVPKLPAAVDAVLFRALSKQPEGRYPSAGALVQDLGLALEGGKRPGAAPAGAYVCARCGYPLPGANTACPVCGGSAAEKSSIR